MSPFFGLVPAFLLGVRCRLCSAIHYPVPSPFPFYTFLFSFCFSVRASFPLPCLIGHSISISPSPFSVFIPVHRLYSSPLTCGSPSPCHHDQDLPFLSFRLHLFFYICRVRLSVSYPACITLLPRLPRVSPPRKLSCLNEHHDIFPYVLRC